MRTLHQNDLKKILWLLPLLIFLTSCDKGYEVRFANYYIEPMDSVVLGSNTVVFVNIEKQVTTEYKKIKKGKYGISLVSKSKKRFNSSITIPGNGAGRRTVQIDGVNQISILEE